MLESSQVQIASHAHIIALVIANLLVENQPYTDTFPLADSPWSAPDCTYRHSTETGLEVKEL